MTLWHHDFETYCDISVVTVGSSVYSRHPSCEPLMLAYSFDNGPVEQWLPALGEPMPADVRDAIRDPDVRPVVWNRAFEHSIWSNALDVHIPAERWIDAQLLAMKYAFPRSLEKCGEALKVSDDHLKDRRGKALIRYFCAPRKATRYNTSLRNFWYDDEEKWEEFKNYNKQDVLSECHIFDKFWSRGFDEGDLEFYAIDQDINERGVPFNVNMVENAQRIVKELTADRVKRLKTLTGLANPNSQQQFLGWLRDKGYTYDDIKKGHLESTLKQLRIYGELLGVDDPDLVIKALELRLDISKASVRKYSRMGKTIDDDGNLRYVFSFYGAGRTGRFSSNMAQLHNLARPTKEFEDGKKQVELAKDIETLGAPEFEEKYDKPFEALSSGLRGCIQAPKGYTLVGADLKAIENIVLGCMSGDRRILKVFEQNLDPYIAFAVELYAETYEELWRQYKAGEKRKRQDSKPAVLGCGYMLSAGFEFEDDRTGEIRATGLLGYAWGMNIFITPEQADRSVKTWRNVHKDTVSFWYDLQEAAWKALTEKRRIDCGLVSFDYEKPFLRMRLPSGRYLRYYKPKIRDCKMPWGDIRPAITYYGLNNKKQFGLLQTHPGKLTENGDQAIAADILKVGIQRAKRRGLDVRLHVHDEIAAVVRVSEAEKAMAILVECMSEPIDWLPDAPLAVEAWESKVWIKE